MWLSAAVQALEFQSTLPRGSDAAQGAIDRLDQDFNPRSLAGATFDYSIYGRSQKNFNPRSLAGATLAPLNSWLLSFNFNPRSLAGATCIDDFCKSHIWISIHAPSRERHANSITSVVTELFQSTLPRGSDLHLNH